MPMIIPIMNRITPLTTCPLTGSPKKSTPHKTVKRMLKFEINVARNKGTVRRAWENRTKLKPVMLPRAMSENSELN